MIKKNLNLTEEEGKEKKKKETKPFTNERETKRKISLRDSLKIQTTMMYVLLGFASKSSVIALNKSQNTNNTKTDPFPWIKYITVVDDEEQLQLDTSRSNSMRLGLKKEENRKTNYNRYIDFDFIEAIANFYFDVKCIYEIKRYLLYDSDVYIQYNGKNITYKQIEKIAKGVKNKIRSKQFIKREKYFEIGELWVKEFGECGIEEPVVSPINRFYIDPEMRKKMQQENVETNN